MSTPKVRQWWINIHGEKHKGFITGDPITDRIPFPIGIERVKVIETAPVLELMERMNKLLQHKHDNENATCDKCAISIEFEMFKKEARE